MYLFLPNSEYETMVAPVVFLIRLFSHPSYLTECKKLYILHKQNPILPLFENQNNSLNPSRYPELSVLQSGPASPPGKELLHRSVEEVPPSGTAFSPSNLLLSQPIDSTILKKEREKMIYRHTGTHQMEL